MSRTFPFQLAPSVVGIRELVQYVEYIATALTVLCVVLTARQHIACWPTGLVAVVLYSYIFFQAKLYSDFGLQIYYVVVQIYGWYYWLHGGKDRAELPVTRQTPRQNGAWVGATIVGTLGLGWTMSTYTDAALPYADAFTTVAALVAQWLLARKKLESWFFWIVIDVVCVRNYWMKELEVTTGLYAFLLVLATWGLFAWWKSMTTTVEALDEEPASP